jgi:outer membrane protein assembly factor BamE (lipoprotein component of BamABCDE complex)
MKTMSIMLLAALGFLIAGCATTFRPWLLSEVHEGMNRGQVEKILGEPDYVESRDGAEYLYYTYREEMTPVSDAVPMSDRDIELRVAEFEQKINDYKYVVVLVDGKVINYKEVQD